MFRTFLGVTLLLAVAAVALADREPVVPPAQQDMHVGPVMAVLTDAITIMDDRDNEVERFLVTPQTKITLNGQPAELVDIQIGDRATVTANLVKERLTAITIDAMRRL
jgi:hypothetical protein